MNTVDVKGLSAKDKMAVQDVIEEALSAKYYKEQAKAGDLRKKITSLEAQLNNVSNEYRDDEVDGEAAGLRGDLYHAERELEEQLAKF